MRRAKEKFSRGQERVAPWLFVIAILAMLALSFALALRPLYIYALRQETESLKGTVASLQMQIQSLQSRTRALVLQMITNPEFLRANAGSEKKPNETVSPLLEFLQTSVTPRAASVCELWRKEERTPWLAHPKRIFEKEDLPPLNWEGSFLFKKGDRLYSAASAFTKRNSKENFQLICAEELSQNVLDSWSLSLGVELFLFVGEKKILTSLKESGQPVFLESSMAKSGVLQNDGNSYAVRDFDLLNQKNEQIGRITVAKSLFAFIQNLHQIFQITAILLIPFLCGCLGFVYWMAKNLAKRIEHAQVLQNFSDIISGPLDLPKLESHLVFACKNILPSFEFSAKFSLIPFSAEGFSNSEFYGSKKWSKVIPGAHLNSIFGILNCFGSETISKNKEQLLENFFNAAQRGYENIKSTQNRVLQAQLESEEKLALRLSAISIPNNIPQGINYSISAALGNQTSLGGTFLFSIFNENQNMIRIYSGDVSGNGLNSVLIAHSVQLTISAFERDAARREKGIVLSEMLELSNDVVRFTGKSLHTMTMLAVEIDLKTGHAELVNAGHPPPLLCEVRVKSMKDDFLVEGIGETGLAGRKARLLKSSGRRLGISDSLQQTTYESIQFKLDSNQIFAVFSQGLTQASNNKEQEFGIDSLAQCLVNRCIHNAEHSIKETLEVLTSFQNGQIQEDDITLMIVQTGQSFDKQHDPSPENLID